MASGAAFLEILANSHSTRGGRDVPRKQDWNNSHAVDLDRLLAEFRADPQIGTGGDLLSAAVTVGDRRREISSIARDMEVKTPFLLQRSMCESIRERDENRERSRFVVTSGGRARINGIPEASNS